MFEHNNTWRYILFFVICVCFSLSNCFSSPLPSPHLLYLTPTNTHIFTHAFTPIHPHPARPSLCCRNKQTTSYPTARNKACGSSGGKKKVGVTKHTVIMMRWEGEVRRRQTMQRLACLISCSYCKFFHIQYITGISTDRSYGQLSQKVVHDVRSFCEKFSFAILVWKVSMKKKHQQSSSQLSRY